MLITDTPFSVSSMIGFLALFGVSVQTAVVYISYANELRLGGFGIAEATRTAAFLRLRPIMMTALVAALGLLPAALSSGVGSDTQKPFALVIVGGLFSRLLISVFLMPVLYAMSARATIIWRCNRPSGCGAFGRVRIRVLSFVARMPTLLLAPVATTAPLQHARSSRQR